jgi:hypothetical protein
MACSQLPDIDGTAILLRV